MKSTADTSIEPKRPPGRPPWDRLPALMMAGEKGKDMNRFRRKALAEIQGKIEDLRSELEALMGEEEEYRDNMPENLQGSERYEAADTACDNMSSALDSLDEAVSYIEEASA